MLTVAMETVRSRQKKEKNKVDVVSQNSKEINSQNCEIQLNEELQTTQERLGMVTCCEKSRDKHEQ